MSIAKKPIGIFGGTFDPIHLGHIDMAKQLFNNLNLRNIQFIPNRRAPTREKPMASEENRLAMIRIAIAAYPQFIANDVELSRPSPSYTIDTVKLLRLSIPKQPICLLMGSDVFSTFNQWHQWEKISDYVHIVVVTRLENGAAKPAWMQNLLYQRQTTRIEDLQTSPCNKIYFHKIKPIPISATLIRKKLMAGEDVSSYLPKKVLDYIEQHHLYRSKN